MYAVRCVSVPCIRQKITKRSHLVVFVPLDGVGTDLTQRPTRGKSRENVGYNTGVDIADPATLAEKRAEANRVNNPYQKALILNSPESVVV